MTGYHVTTKAKVKRYLATGCILPPVRFWAFENSARAWGEKCSRDTVLKIEVKEVHPLPDHKPKGHAYWADEFVRKWEDLSK